MGRRPATGRSPDGELKETGQKDVNGSKMLFPRSRTTKGMGTGMAASEITFPSVPGGDKDNQGDRRPLSFDAKPGESTNLTELERRRDEVTFDEGEEGTADLLMAGWKQVEGGMWEQPKTGFKYDQELALKALNDDPSVGREY